MKKYLVQAMLKNELSDGGRVIMPSIRRIIGRIDASLPIYLRHTFLYQMTNNIAVACMYNNKDKAVDALKRVRSEKWVCLDGCLGDYFDFFITTVELEPKPISVELYED